MIRKTMCVFIVALSCVACGSFDGMMRDSDMPACYIEQHERLGAMWTYIHPDNPEWNRDDWVKRRGACWEYARYLMELIKMYCPYAQFSMQICTVENGERHAVLGILPPDGDWWVAEIGAPGVIGEYGRPWNFPYEWDEEEWWLVM